VPPLLILFGLRGSGKSTVGAIVAERLGRTFTDLDDRTAALGGAPCAELLRTLGEEAFRRLELRALQAELDAADARHAPGILSLGGGTPTLEASRLLLASARDLGLARLIYLAAGAETLRQRLRGTDLATRPGLKGDDPLAEIELLLQERDPIYRRLADRTIPTDALTPDQVAERIIAEVGAPSPSPPAPPTPHPQPRPPTSPAHPSTA
jgi:shikimate kinase